MPNSEGQYCTTAGNSQKWQLFKVDWVVNEAVGLEIRNDDLQVEKGDFVTLYDDLVWMKSSPFSVDDVEMLLTVKCDWHANFRCVLASAPDQNKLEVIEFVNFYIPADFGYTWKPELTSLKPKLTSPESSCRRTIRLFHRQPVDSECFFKLVRCLVTPTFWQNARSRLSNRYLQRSVSKSGKSARNDTITNTETLLIFVVCASPQPSVHIAWYRRILALINEFIHVYEVMAWLSTLGGAYSAMGDYCDRAKLVARQISAKQLQLAARLGDPTQVCRCWIFLAMSAIQHGRFDTSRQILKRQWRFVHTVEGQRDPRLKNMVQGVWSRLVYERKLRNIKASNRAPNEAYSRES